MHFNKDEFGARSEGHWAVVLRGQRVQTQRVGNGVVSGTGSGLGKDRHLAQCSPVTSPSDPRHFAQSFTDTSPSDPRHFAQSFRRKSLQIQVVSSPQQINKDLNKQTTKRTSLSCCFSGQGGQG